MDLSEETQPLTVLRDHPVDMLAHLKATGRPVVLTVDGAPAAVVQDAEAYRHLQDLAAEASAAEGIRQGLEDLKAGRVRDAREVFSELRARHGVRC